MRLPASTGETGKRASLIIERVKRVLWGPLQAGHRCREPLRARGARAVETGRDGGEPDRAGGGPGAGAYGSAA